MAVISVVNIIRNTGCVILVFCLLVVDFTLAGRRISFRRNTGTSRIRHSRISGTATKAAIVGGLLFGSAAYMIRRRYRNGYYRPTVCQNIRYGRFICPMESQPDSYGYCCGYAGEESCCMVSHARRRSSGGGGRMAGIVIGALIGIGVIIAGVAVIVCMVKKRGVGRRKATTTARPAAGMAYYQPPAPTNQWQQGKNDMQMMNDPYPAYQPSGGSPYPTGAAPYPVSTAPVYPGNMGQDGSTQPPYQPYPASGAPPYPVSPMPGPATPYPSNTGVSSDPPPNYNAATYGGYGCPTTGSTA